MNIKNQYRIVEKTFSNGHVKYILEKSNDDVNWVSVYAHDSLEEIRKAKAKKESFVVNEKVID